MFFIPSLARPPSLFSGYRILRFFKRRATPSMASTASATTNLIAVKETEAAQTRKAASQKDAAGTLMAQATGALAAPETRATLRRTAATTAPAPTHRTSASVIPDTKVTTASLWCRKTCTSSNRATWTSGLTALSSRCYPNTLRNTSQKQSRLPRRCAGTQLSRLAGAPTLCCSHTMSHSTWTARPTLACK